MDFDVFFYSSIFSQLFRPFPKLPWHTCGHFMLHQFAVAHRFEKTLL
jgi:hypothetical protein